MNREEGEARIVSVTVDTFKLAKRVIEEWRHHDGESYSEKPSVTELAVIAQTITVMSMNGAYRTQDDPVPEPVLVAKVVRAGMDQLKKLIEVTVENEVRKQQRPLK